MGIEGKYGFNYPWSEDQSMHNNDMNVSPINKGEVDEIETSTHVSQSLDSMENVVSHSWKDTVSILQDDNLSWKQKVLLANEDEVFHLYNKKIRKLEKEFGEAVAARFARMWLLAWKTPNKQERLELQKKTLMLRFSRIEWGLYWIEWIPWFDRSGRSFSVGYIMPFWLRQHMSFPNTDIPSLRITLDKIRESVVIALKKHELWEKVWTTQSFKKFGISEKYEKEYFLVPKTHPIGKLDESRLKEFFPTVDEIRALEERAGYNTELLVELFNIPMPYTIQQGENTLECARLLLADGKGEFGDPASWTIIRSTHWTDKTYTSTIKPISSATPVLVQWFLRKPKVEERSVLQTAASQKKIDQYTKDIEEAKRKGDDVLVKKLESKRSSIYATLHRRTEAEKTPHATTKRRWKNQK